MEVGIQKNGAAREQSEITADLDAWFRFRISRPTLVDSRLRGNDGWYAQTPQTGILAYKQRGAAILLIFAHYQKVAHTTRIDG